MKNYKFRKNLYVVISLLCSLFFMYSITVYAHYEGTTEVTARIEVSSETSQNNADDNSSFVPQEEREDNSNTSIPSDEDTVTTGDITQILIVGLSFILIISAFILYICTTKKKCNLK